MQENRGLFTLDGAQAYLAADVPVGPCLADQLMIPMALSGGGEFRTLPLSRHATTNIEIMKHFLDVDVEVHRIDRPEWHVKIVRN